MYYSGLSKSIRDLDEKRFYDIAILFLSAKGYRDLAITDGPNDGGRDVQCNFQHLRIQLSVRKDWQQKINSDAKSTKESGKNHLIYVTNRRILDSEREDFIQANYCCKGAVELTVFDLATIATTLSLPANADTVRQALGICPSGRFSATPKEIAISTTLLFSNEARELRDHVIENSVRAHVFSSAGITEDELCKSVSEDLGNLSIADQIRRTVQRLKSKGEIIHQEGKCALSADVCQKMTTARNDFLCARDYDVKLLIGKYNLSETDAIRLVELALEIQARGQAFESNDTYAVALLSFLANHRLQPRKMELYEDVSRLTSAKVAQFGGTICHILATDTFDILRALGASRRVVAILDSSVAMPMLFGLCFRSVRSQYGIGAAALHTMCKAHAIDIQVPRPYLNEMVYHGLKALEYVSLYNIVGDESRSVLRASCNAYISHFACLRDDNSALSLTLDDFLKHFGIQTNISRGEQRIESLLASFGITVIDTPKHDRSLLEMVRAEKRNEEGIIVEHDANVLTLLTKKADSGYIFATWDKVLRKLVEETSRIYADTPSRIVDFLTMAQGSDFETEQTFSLLDSLIYCDEQKAIAVAKKIEAIRSTDVAYELQRYADHSRRQSPHDKSSLDIVEEFFSQHLADTVVQKT